MTVYCFEKSQTIPKTSIDRCVFTCTTILLDECDFDYFTHIYIIKFHSLPSTNQLKICHPPKNEWTNIIMSIIHQITNSMTIQDRSNTRSTTTTMRSRRSIPKKSILKKNKITMMMMMILVSVRSKG